MAYEATPERASAIAAVRASEAFRAALRVGLSTRLAVLLVAVFAALSFGPASGGLARENADKFDEPGAHARARRPAARAARPLGLRLVPADRRLGLWRAATARAAFFPLYPLLVRGPWARRSAGRTAALLVAAYLVSLAAFLARAGAAPPACRARAGAPPGAPDARCCSPCSRPPCTSARPTPRASSSCWRSAPSTRRGRVAGHGPARAPGLASASRSAGLLLLLPLALIWWSSRPRRPRDAAWLAPGAARHRRLRRLARPRGGRRAALPRRPGGVVAGARGAARRGLGRSRRRAWTGCGSSARARGRRSTSSSRPVTRSGSPRST